MAMATTAEMVISRLDLDALRDSFTARLPLRWVCIDDLLEPDFAREVSRSFPPFEEARLLGREFSAVNERRKVQIADRARLPAAAGRLSDALASPDWLACLTRMTAIPNLVADQELAGGGLHLYARGARLDVHVDFNYIAERMLYRRLNLLLFLNERWEAEWGGELEFWDPDVQHLLHAFRPSFNRCVIFETSEISFHGVRKVKAPDGLTRRSFAAYYYTRDQPADWNHTVHSTVFRARPNEWLRRGVLMPLEASRRALRSRARRIVREFLRR